MPLQATSGAASYDAFGGGAAAVPQYIEDVFSTYLYTGNKPSTQTVTNGIDLSGKGGMVWTKNRASATFPANVIFDTARGAGAGLITNSTAAQDTSFTQSFSSTGFDLGGDNLTNQSGITYASWTFRKQPKFFDVVTFVGTGANLAVNHNLGSVPGCIIIKNLDASRSWQVYHRSVGNTAALQLNATSAAGTSNVYWNDTTPTSTQFTIGTQNEVGNNYVAYLFAHDAGGFGLTGTDNVISCGSYTGNGSATGPVVTLGYEPQWLLIKEATQSGNSWSLIDNMRGLTTDGPSGHLRPNTSDAEDTTSVDVRPTSTGFQPISSSGRVNRSGETFIYIAIRRGPMKVPTDATKVFAPIALAYQAAGTQATTNFPVDLAWWKNRDGGQNGQSQDRLRGLPNTDGVGAPTLFLDSTAAEDPNQYKAYEFWNTGFRAGSGSADRTQVWWTFRRAPSFFDEVCYTGNGGSGSPITVSHNLGVVPELMIVKGRNYASSFWTVYTATTGNTQALYLNLTNGNGTDSAWGSTTPTSTVFTVGSNDTNNTGKTYVAYLFATCAGVSKVGSYTGNGTTQTINCGFGAGGARFVLIKRTDTTGGWYVYDTARGMTTLTDPYLLLNSTAADAATLGSVTTVSTGFALNSTILAAINVSGGTYIFLAIA
jgi:hypothetical protein